MLHLNFSWLFPIIGHMGITTSTGIIRDFSGSFYVAEDDMAFGNPTKYWQLDINTVSGGSKAWDKAVNEASIEYFNRMVYSVILILELIYFKIIEFKIIIQ